MPVLKTAINQQQPDALFAFTNGVKQDARLAAQEVQVQTAWVNGLQALGVFSDEEAAQVKAALKSMLADMDAGRFSWDIRDEDIHMHVEKYVTEACGDLGKKMHLGRSRNDLIATTLRLFLRDSLAEITLGVERLIAALQAQMAKTKGIIVPGMTHLQHGQPVRFSHILHAHAHMLKKDLKKIAQAQVDAMEEMPLGAAALGGTSLAIDLDKMAKELGFKAPLTNSYDIVGNRDFILSGLNALANIAVHLGRLSEDCIFWASSAVKLMQLPQRWSTGSSIMPNKRNPDVPELTRGKAAHVIAAQNNGHMLMRTIPTSYGSDMHELKQVYLTAFDEIRACLSVWDGFISEMEINPVRAEALCNQGHILATEIADDLVAKGASFRDAYQQVAALVIEADKQGKQVHEIYEGAKITTQSAVAKRNNIGGTGGC